MKRPLLIVLGALVCLIAAAALIFVQQDPVPAPGTAPSINPSPSAASNLSELSAFVEEARGLKFKEVVNIVTVSQGQFDEALRGAAVDPRQIARTEVILTILGLLPPEADLSALVAASDYRAAALYDPAVGVLVAEGELTPNVRKAIVHELARALDEQNFGTDRQIVGEDAAAAYAGLLEGSAIQVERAYISSLPPEEQQQIEPGGQAVKPAFEQLLAFPRTYGPPFVAALLKEDPARLDQAFVSPPVSTEQVIDPARYLSADSPQAVKPPNTEGPAIDEGDFGPVLLRLVLETQLGAPAAGDAASGWDGDRYVTWQSPDGRTCIRVAFAADSPEDIRQLQAALAEWVDRVTDREVDSAGLLLKACERRA